LFPPYLPLLTPFSPVCTRFYKERRSTPIAKFRGDLGSRFAAAKAATGNKNPVWGSAPVLFLESTVDDGRAMGGVEVCLTFCRFANPTEFVAQIRCDLGFLVAVLHHS
jgi:hypothetical protein